MRLIPSLARPRRPWTGPGRWSQWPKEKKVELLNTAVIGGMALYGLLFWGYGGHAFQFVNEGWFQQDSIHGGADKLGHAFSTYVGTMSYGAVYEKWGYDRHVASRLGALSGFATFFMIEFGDAFSNHGFSLEDLAADAVGALWGYLRREHPALRGLVDFRVSYFPSWGSLNGHTTDYISDYSGFTYLLAFKGRGVEALSSTWLKYLEFHAGYYTRGYEPQDWCHYGDPHRVLYAGIALNLSDLVRKTGWRKTATFLEFYQPPWTELSTSYNMDR
ncbi:MAG: DUF2279 domain-containing protein [Kiritimatiellae bacterium]|nr:DUF2279 domain-containing protein [Kiritimatiellia bacterium]